MMLGVLFLSVFRFNGINYVYLVSWEKDHNVSCVLEFLRVTLRANHTRLLCWFTVLWRFPIHSQCLQRGSTDNDVDKD